MVVPGEPTTAPVRRVAPGAVRWLLLALLPLLAALLYERGQHYDPSLLDFKSGGSRMTAFLPEQVENWQRLATIRPFDKANLYEYIDGHAEYFLSAGFRALTVAEYRLPTDTQQPSAVVDLYDMGEPLNAFGVLMDEIGVGGQPVAVGDVGFQAPRSLGFVAGQYYVKLAAFADNLSLLVVAQAVHQAILKGAGQSLGKASLNLLFPDLGMVTTTRFIKENYHGWSFLQRVAERRFQRADGTAILAFSVSVTPQQRSDLERNFLSFMQQEGTGVTETKVEGMRILQVSDRYEGDWIVLPLDTVWLGIFHPLDEEMRPALKAFAHHE